MNSTNTSYWGENRELIEPLAYFIERYFSPERLATMPPIQDPAEYSSLRFQLEELMRNRDLSLNQYEKLSGHAFESEEKLYEFLKSVYELLLTRETANQKKLWAWLLTQPDPKHSVRTNPSDVEVCLVPDPLRSQLLMFAADQNFEPEEIARSLHHGPAEDAAKFRIQLTDALTNNTLSLEQIARFLSRDSVTPKQAREYLVNVWKGVYPQEPVPGE